MRTLTKFPFPRFLVGAILAGALVSCGHADKAEMPAPPAPLSVAGEPAVSGELADYLTIVPGSYQVTVSPNDLGDMGGYKLTAKVKVRFIKAKDMASSDDNSCCGPELVARLLDASGAPVTGFERLTDDIRRTELAGMMKRGTGEEWLTFSTQDSFFDKETATQKATAWLATLQQAKKIGLVSSVSVADANAAKDSESLTTDANALMAQANAAVAAASGASATESDEATSGSDCDAFLKGYGEYVNDYVALAKEMQANPSNTALLAKSSAMSMKAATWASKAKGCENDPDFQSKYSALSTKMALGMVQ